jgi:thiol-disulfide isomerase/thioredoxin
MSDTLNKKRLSAYVLVAAAFTTLGAIAAVKKETRQDAAPAGPAASLYSQSLNDLSGKPQALAQWKGKPLLVNFWASWCAPCVQEMPELSALAAKDGGKRFHVIGIGIDSPSNLVQFTQKTKVAYPLYVGGIGATDLARGLGNDKGGLPYTVLIGADGKVIKTYLGKLKFDQLKADLARL